MANEISAFLKLETSSDHAGQLARRRATSLIFLTSRREGVTTTFREPSTCHFPPHVSTRGRVALCDGQQTVMPPVSCIMAKVGRAQRVTSTLHVSLSLQQQSQARKPQTSRSGLHPAGLADKDAIAEGPSFVLGRRSWCWRVGGGASPADRLASSRLCRNIRSGVQRTLFVWLLNQSAIFIVPLLLWRSETFRDRQTTGKGGRILLQSSRDNGRSLANPP